MSFLEYSGKHSAHMASSSDYRADKNSVPTKQLYSFPVLKMADIVKCLNELGINITLEELTKPEEHIGACHHMYELLVEICTALTRDDISQASFGGLQNMEYQQLHENSIPRINLLRACNRMMEMCEIKDFTIKDFFVPTAKRLRQHLSGIINFAKFREERLMLLSDLSASRENLMDHMSQLRDTNATLNTRLSLLREQTSEEGNQINHLETEVRDIETQLNALNDLQNSIKVETNQLRAVNEDLKEQIAIASVEFENNTTLHKKLSKQIVSSPEKFRKQIVEVGQNLQLEQKDAKLAERKVRDLSAWLVNVEESNTEVSSALDSICEVRGEVERQKAVILDLDAKRQGTQARRVALKEIDQNLHQIDRHVDRAETKLTHLRQQSNVKGEEAQRSIDELHKQLMDAEAKRVQVRARAERADGEATRLDKEAEAEYLQQEQEVLEITASYQRLERIVTAHLRSLQRAVESKQQSKASNFV